MVAQLLYPLAISPDKPAIVEFLLEEITDLELADFSYQNVVSGLNVKQATDQHSEAVDRLTLHPCFGLDGRIDAKQVRFNLVPGESTNGRSLW